MKVMLPKKAVRIVRSLGLLALVIAAICQSAQAQSTSEPLHSSANSPSPSQPALRFDVISIHHHPFAGNEPSNRRMFPGGRFVATATTARTLIRIAFGTDDNRISGAPRWIDDQMFDISATTIDHHDVKTTEQFQQLILSLLEDRFELKFHHLPKEGPVFWLELNKPGKLGPALKQSTVDSQPNMSTNSNGVRTVMKVSKMSMADIAAGLRRQAGRPVEDHTGLPGNFDFQIEWAPDETPDSIDQSLFTVLKEQLGLKLRPAKGVIDMLVVDHIAQPSDN